MSTATLAYPPPLSVAPTVETLEQLLAGLQRPVERGVPTPPAELAVPERLFADVPQFVPVRIDAPRPVPLTWSAGAGNQTLPFPLNLLSPLALAASTMVSAALAAIASRSELVAAR